MARIVILQHNDHAHGGRLVRTLRDHGFRLDTRRADLPGGVPTDIDDLHGLVVLGGAQNVDEGHAFLRDEQSLIRKMHEAGRPVIGICLGAQQIAVALGGKVEKMAAPEVGVLPVSLSMPGQTETILAGIPWSCPQLHSHGYQVTQAPAGAVVLASSRACKVQAYRAGQRTFGFQYHFECDRAMTSEMFDRSMGLAEKAGVTRAAMEDQHAEHAEMMHRAADRLCVNLASFAFSFDELLAV